MSIYAITEAKDNADLMVICRDLGYLFSGNGHILDATYGKGRFWTKYRPDGLVTNDLDPRTDATFHDDFRKTKFPPESFHVVVFDPPYGYRGTSRLASDADYGLGEYLSVDERHKLMADGMSECVRLLCKGGRLLFKMQDQSVSSTKHWQTIMFANLGRHLGLVLEDQLHLRSVRAQPAGKTQNHSWANYSTLQVHRKVAA